MLITCGMCQVQTTSPSPRGSEDCTLVLWACPWTWRRRSEHGHGSYLPAQQLPIS